MEKVNQEILNKLKQIQIDIEFIKETIGDGDELTDWAKDELAEARTIPDSEMLPLEEVEKKILAK